VSRALPDVARPEGDPAIDVVRNPRARRTRLAVDHVTGRVRLTLPPRISTAAGLRWAAGQRGWIDAQLARLPQPRPFAPGARVPVDDAELLIVWQAGGARRVVRDGDRLVTGGPVDTLDRRITAWLRAEALRLLSADTADYAELAGVTVSRVTIGDPRGRWGSCATSGIIRYSWRLVLAPRWVRRATAAHEVAHRRHMHHGPDFHALVAELYGADPTPARHWLRRHGAALHWFGRGAG